MIASSKQRAKMSCAAVLAEVMVQRGWADVKKRAKKRKHTDGEKVQTKIKRMAEGGLMEGMREDIGEVRTMTTGVGDGGRVCGWGSTPSPGVVVSGEPRRGGSLGERFL